MIYPASHDILKIVCIERLVGLLIIDLVGVKRRSEKSYGPLGVTD